MCTYTAHACAGVCAGRSPSKSEEPLTFRIKSRECPLGMDDQKES